MNSEQRLEKANSIKAVIDQTKPVTEWRFTSNVWISPKGDIRVYVNDKKNKPAAVLVIGPDGTITPQWQAGHSLTRNEIKAAIQELR